MNAHTLEFCSVRKLSSRVKIVGLVFSTGFRDVPSLICTFCLLQEELNMVRKLICIKYSDGCFCLQEAVRCALLTIQSQVVVTLNFVTIFKLSKVVRFVMCPCM